jgi:hypothetical protein
VIPTEVVLWPWVCTVAVAVAVAIALLAALAALLLLLLDVGRPVDDAMLDLRLPSDVGEVLLGWPMAAGGRAKDTSMEDGRDVGLAAWISVEGAGVGNPVVGIAANAGELIPQLQESRMCDWLGRVRRSTMLGEKATRVLQRLASSPYLAQLLEGDRQEMALLRRGRGGPSLNGYSKLDDG